MGDAAAGRTTGWPIARRGLMLVLSSPSGAGKTTLSRKLLAADPAVTLSCGSCGARPYTSSDRPRVDGMRRSPAAFASRSAVDPKV